MQLFDSISKCKATVTVLADGQECPQYNISGDEHGNMTCYIPLMSEQFITVDVALDMVSEHFEVDFFLDGVIRNFWQSTRNSVNKHRAPIVGFTEGIYKNTRSMYRGEIIATPIPEVEGKFKDGARMQEADRSGTRRRLKRTRQGSAPWATFKFIYREPAQLRAAGIGKAICNAAFPGLNSNASRKRPAEDDHGDSSLISEAELQSTRAHVADLRAEILELKMETDRAKRRRLEKEKETDELARQVRQEWADLELARADLARELADEKAKAAAQEVGLVTVLSMNIPLTHPKEEQISIRNRYANAVDVHAVSK
ncbi:MAG: hypothetical protein Q9182_007594 [Xanthomendoza sp. 2 TL-2023]